MCLIAFAWNAHPDYPLIVAANRDEFHDRPTEAADWWQDQPGILAGRDLQAGGTWLAVSRAGRFATVTNYREQSFTRIEHTSRGRLPIHFATDEKVPQTYVDTIDGDDYAGFNLLVADFENMSYASNRGDAEHLLGKGVYGLSNAALDTPWAKVERSKARLGSLIDRDAISEDALFSILYDRTTSSEDVNAAHLAEEQARAITAPFIVSETYGTRSSTLVLRHVSGRTDFHEKRFDRHGIETGHSSYSFDALAAVA